MADDQSPNLRHFSYSHLQTKKLRDVSKHFHDLAWNLEEILPKGPEKSVSLRKLLEAKDAAVRAALET